ncbi:MAG: hypothetical protein H3C47_02435 [Candidatus Cloacimonetes bacterium]|nr:hypothetical protein [Candidatus Cloacimonadota bacterium]
MTVLSQTRVESEEAHFRNNPAPLLKTYQLKHSRPAQNLDLHNYQTWLFGMLERFQKLRNAYTANGIRIKEAWGFLYFKCLLLNTADFVLAQKNRQSPLSRVQILSLLALLKQNTTLRYYLQGAKLSLLIDSSDALSDAELFYLTRTPCTDDEEPPKPLLLGTYHETLLEDLIASMRQELRSHINQKARTKVQAVAAVGCILVLPVMGWLMQIP